MTTETHRKRHEELHKHLDELVWDMVAQTNKLPNKTTVLELMEWSHLQTLSTETVATIAPKLYENS
jgi:hypothetical protein